VTERFPLGPDWREVVLPGPLPEPLPAPVFDEAWCDERGMPREFLELSHEQQSALVFDLKVYGSATMERGDDGVVRHVRLVPHEGRTR
jgi:hypothetical protein